MLPLLNKISIDSSNQYFIILTVWNELSQDNVDNLKKNRKKNIDSIRKCEFKIRLICFDLFLSTSSKISEKCLHIMQKYFFIR